MTMIRPSSFHPTSKLILHAVFFRCGLFALLWWGLCEGRLHAPFLALLAIGLAVAASLLFVPPGSWKFRLMGLISFLPYFLYQSLVAGWDVSKRALSPRLPVSPSVIRYPLTLRSRAGRIFLVWIVSMLPGTASIALDAEYLTVHLLAGHLPHEERLRELEKKIEMLFANSNDGGRPA